MRAKEEYQQGVSPTAARIIFLGGFLLFAAIIAGGMAMAGGVSFALPSLGRDAKLLLMSVAGIGALILVLR
jgi:hypothetical protein